MMTNQLFESVMRREL